MIWKGAINAGGYGYVLVNGRRLMLHRFVLELISGERFADGEVAMHLCDQRACIRPDHLRRGTQVDNMADYAAKRQAGTWRGNRSRGKQPWDGTLP